MPAEQIDCPTHCRTCGSALTLEETHYYDHGDGTCTCDACEKGWSGNVDRWRRGELAEFPKP